MLFDFKTREWVKLGVSEAGYPNWSKDGKDVYFAEVSGPGFSRIEIATRRTEEVARYGEAHAVDCVAGAFSWFGMTPDGSPLMARQAGSQEIYTLDVDLP